MKAMSCRDLARLSRLRVLQITCAVLDAFKIGAVEGTDNYRELLRGVCRE
jgi:hypothetical protein